MAKRATFICRHKRVPELYFNRAVHTFFGYSIFLSSRDTDRDPNATIYEKTFLKARPGKQAQYLLSIRASVGKELPTLMSLMGTLYASKKDPVNATDPRDKVFAILGLAKDDMGLQPDYDLTCAEVFTEVTIAMLRSGQIEVLSFCRPHLNNLRLPSWVVDWTSEVGYYLGPFDRSLSHHLESFDRFLSVFGSIVYDEAEDVRNVRPFIQPGPEPVLSVRGTILDQIQSTSQSWQEYRTTLFQSLDSLTASLESWAPAPASLSRDIAEVILRHVVCRGWLTMLRDLMGNLQLHENIDVDEIVWDILSAGDTDGDDVKTGTRPKNLVEAMKLFAASEDYREWLYDIRCRGHFFYIVGMIEAKAQGYRACASVNGYVGYAPEPTQTTDLIVMFAGAQTPYIIRPTDCSRHKLLGPAYIRDIMQSGCTKESDWKTTIDLV
jgi:hypothetical protein